MHIQSKLLYSACLSRAQVPACVGSSVRERGKKRGRDKRIGTACTGGYKGVQAVRPRSVAGVGCSMMSKCLQSVKNGCNSFQSVSCVIVMGLATTTQFNQLSTAYFGLCAQSKIVSQHKAKSKECFRQVISFPWSKKFLNAYCHRAPIYLIASVFFDLSLNLPYITI